MKFQSHPRHKEIRSYVMWDEIKTINRQTGQQGLYVWADPTDIGILNLQRLLAAFPDRKSMKNGTEFHCTVLYSKSEPEHLTLEFPQDRRDVIRAQITHFEAWQDHKDRTIVVARVKSPTLLAYHRYFLSMGFTSDFPEYNAHITVAKDVPRNTALHIWLDSINSQLQFEQVDVPMSGTLHASALA